MNTYYANAKINIGLNIIEKRPDGFHNIDVFFIKNTNFDFITLKKKDIMAALRVMGMRFFLLV